MKKKLAMVGIVILIGVIVALMYRSRNQHEEGVLTLSGNVEITEVNTGFKFSGRIRELLAEEGQTINKGDKMAVLDGAELESQVIQSRAYVSETLTRLAELRAGARLQEIEQGDLENPWIKVYVKEDKLGLVKLGQKAGITTDSYPGKKYEGVITYISSEAEFTPKNVQTQEERVKLVFGIKVSAKNGNGELKPGMPADVKIRLK